MKGLIVTADDFGNALEVNEAVERGHKEGILTCASLMVTGEAAPDAVARARKMPGLGVGLHLVLVEGKPVLPSSQVPALVGPDGNFRNDMVKASFGMALFPSVKRQLADEIGAQFEAFAATGLKLDHVNAHKHFHLHPTVGRLVVEIGKKYGLEGVRAPCEPIGVLRDIEPGTRGGDIERFCGARLKDRLWVSGVWSPDHVFGLAWSGAMTPERVTAILEHLPEGVSEIYVHPATKLYAGGVQGYRYVDEFRALVSPRAVTLAKQMSSGVFRDFSRRPRNGKILRG